LNVFKYIKIVLKYLVKLLRIKIEPLGSAPKNANQSNDSSAAVAGGAAAAGVVVVLCVVIGLVLFRKMRL
jgi:hypothetical protein